MEKTKQVNNGKRKFLEVDEETYKKVQILCFLKDTNIKRFAIKTMQEKLQPYEQWLENIKKLKTG